MSSLRTTLLNPTIWVLALTAALGLMDAMRRRRASETLDRVLHCACRMPVLLLLVVLGVTGVGSRIVLGYMSPGAYAEEVAAARAFIKEGRLYGSDPRSAVAELMPKTTTDPPWGHLPGITACQANAMEQRARFFTNHAHTPMFLLASVPVVAVAGGRMLYTLILMLSLTAVGVVTTILLRWSGQPLQSRPGLLLLLSVAGWAPVLAGIRQADAVLPAAGLVVLAWYMVSVHRSRAASISAAIAGSIALPAIGVFGATLRSVPKTGVAAILLFLGVIAATVWISPVGTLTAFVHAIGYAAQIYSAATSNYSFGGRIGSMGFGIAPVIVVSIAITLVTWWMTRTSDEAFAAFLIAGLLLAPLLWSQHLALIIVPAAVLLRRIWTHGSSVALMMWAMLMLLLSLPDPAVALVSEAVSVRWISGDVLPVGFFALPLLWGWVTFGAAGRTVVSSVAVPFPAAPAEVK